MKATLFLIAMTIATRVYGHDVAGGVFSDDRTLKRFLGATNVTAERLSLKSELNGLMGDAPKLSGYTRGENMVIPEAEAKELKSLFTAESSFLWHSEPKNGLRQVKACMPNYGVLLTFRGSDGAVSIALCFECDLFGVFWSDGDKEFRVNAEEDLDIIRPQLVELVKRLFPRDATIQSLKPVNPNDGT